MPLLGSLQERVGAKAIATVGPGLFGVACLISASATSPLPIGAYFSPS